MNSASTAEEQEARTRRGPRWTGDAAGALAASFVALPQAISLGVLAFAPLGASYASLGVISALLAIVVGNLVVTATYAVKCQIVGPRSAASALVAGLMAAVLMHPALQGAASADVPLVLGVVFFTVMLAGAIQLLLGLLGIGRAIKFVPYPVIAGFMNGLAIIILLSQVRPVLGLEGHRSLAITLAEIGEARWGSVLTATCVLAAIFLAPRVTKRVPILFAGLAAGVTVHYALALLAPGTVGGVIGPLPGVAVMASQLSGAFDGLPALLATDRSLLQLVVSQAGLIAVVAGLDGLLAAVFCDAVTRGRHDSNRVLVGQGLANVLGGAVGALPSQINTHTPLANFAAGGRTRLSALLHAVFVGAIILGLSPLVAWIPISALGGIMLYVAYSLMDRWSGELVRGLRAGKSDRAEVVTNIGIVVLVALAQVAMNLMAALAMGVTASVALLLAKLSQSPVRRQFDGLARTSHKVRSPAARESLEELAPRIQVLELQGELFFGTADRLQSEIDALPAHAEFVILDFRRVFQVDASGSRVLQVIGQRAARRGLRVLLSEVRVDDERGRYLESMGVAIDIPQEHWFVDLDRALEWAEDQLLRQARFEEFDTLEMPLSGMALFAGLTEDELGRLRAVLERHDLANGEPVFLEGDAGDHLYLIARGAVSIKMRIADEERARRIATLAPGVIFGEMALLEGKQRSADAFAKGDRVVLYTLSRAALEHIGREHPAIGSRIHLNLGRELAARLRATSAQLRALE